jgi:hypothetical protein
MHIYGLIYTYYMWSQSEFDFLRLQINITEYTFVYVLRNRWEICLSMREQNEPRNCVEYTQRVFTKRHNRVNIAKCLYKINDCFMLKMDMI